MKWAWTSPDQVTHEHDATTMPIARTRVRRLISGRFALAPESHADRRGNISAQPGANRAHCRCARTAGRTTRVRERRREW